MRDAQEQDWVLVDELDALDIELSLDTAIGSPAGSSIGSAPFVKYPAKLHAEKVLAELHLSEGIIFIPGEVSKDLKYSDQGRPFRQNRYFFYLSGHNHPDCAVTYDIAAKKLTLWIVYTEPGAILWYGRTPTVEECQASYDVDEVRYRRDLQGFLDGLSPSTTVYALEPSELELWPLRPGQKRDCKKLMPAMDEARVVKSDYEVAMIRTAARISSLAHRQVARRLLALSDEHQVQALFEATCHWHGARNMAYSTIAGAGANAATLHYTDNCRPLRPNQLLVLDAAAEWNCYAADITRTLPIRGAFSPEAAAVHDAVEAMQDACIAMVKPGRLFIDLADAAAVIATRRLRALGILRGAEADLMAQRAYRLFFPHGLGHPVGLEVHDVQGWYHLYVTVGVVRSRGRGADCLVPPPAVRAGQPGAASDPAHSVVGYRKLQPNMVVTIEPGIYFCREFIEDSLSKRKLLQPYVDLAVVEKYYDVGGVRIEDDILVTADGYEVLSTAPKGKELLKLINGN